MAEFICKVADANGRVFTQVEIGNNTAEVRRRLDDKGLYVYSVKGRTLPRWLERTSGAGFKRLSGDDFLLFNQQLATLIKAGLPILQSLDLLGRRSNKPAIAEMLGAVREKVKGGVALSDAMQGTGIFSPVYCTALLAGEKGGDLVGVLDQYVAYQRVTTAVQRKLRNALIYPAILISFSVFVLTYVIGFVIPQFSSLYKEMGADLPALTQFVIAAALRIRDSLLLIVGGAGAAFMALLAFSRSGAGARTLDRIWMDAPVIGDVVRKFRLSQFSRTLGTLLRGGVPLVTALETAGGAMDSPVLRQAVLHATERVREGQSLNGSLAETGVIPEMVTEMVEVGEATGSLSEMLTSVAEFYDEELNARIAGLMAMVEPLLLIVVGGTVLFILVALYLPIFSVGQAIQ